MSRVRILAAVAALAAAAGAQTVRPPASGIATRPRASTPTAQPRLSDAQLEADIRAMPMGMHTVIGEGAGGLSGGQR